MKKKSCSLLAWLALLLLAAAAGYFAYRYRRALAEGFSACVSRVRRVLAQRRAPGEFDDYADL